MQACTFLQLIKNLATLQRAEKFWSTAMKNDCWSCDNSLLLPWFLILRKPRVYIDQKGRYSLPSSRAVWSTLHVVCLDLQRQVKNISIVGRWLTRRNKCFNSDWRAGSIYTLLPGSIPGGILKFMRADIFDGEKQLICTMISHEDSEHTHSWISFPYIALSWKYASWLYACPTLFPRKGIWSAQERFGDAWKQHFNRESCLCIAQC